MAVYRFLVPEQWIVAPPTVQARDNATPKPGLAALSTEEASEIREAAARAIESLSLGRIRNPGKVAEAIHAAIDAFRQRKRVSKSEKRQTAIDLGVLWGEALKSATGWEWQCLNETDGGSTDALCSPDRAHAVAPLQIVFALLTSPKSVNNSLLLFNRITAGELPV